MEFYFLKSHDLFLSFWFKMHKRPHFLKFPLGPEVSGLALFPSFEQDNSRLTLIMIERLRCLQRVDHHRATPRLKLMYDVGLLDRQVSVTQRRDKNGAKYVGGSEVHYTNRNLNEWDGITDSWCYRANIHYRWLNGFGAIGWFDPGFVISIPYPSPSG